MIPVQGLVSALPAYGIYDEGGKRRLPIDGLGGEVKGVSLLVDGELWIESVTVSGGVFRGLLDFYDALHLLRDYPAVQMAKE